MIWNPFNRNKSTLKVSQTVKNSIKPMVLLVLDGWGVAPPSNGNAITRAKTPNMDQLLTTYPNTTLIASGESVGLPANEVGNSEVGHLTIGVGGVIFQSLKRINLGIEDGTFLENNAFIQAVQHVKKHKSKLHLLGLTSNGSVHSALNHLYALLEFCKKSDLTNVVVHAFTDGRDAAPTSGAKVIEEVESQLEALRIGKIASVAGRYYAMDRDRRWERTQKSYDAIVSGIGPQAASASQAVKDSYTKDKTDEFVEPTVIVENGKPVGLVNDNDAVIFFNFRVDRPRQLTMAFVMPDFEKLKEFELGHDPDHGKKDKTVVSGPTFKRQKWPQNLFFVTMTQYQKTLPVSAVAYMPLKATNPLPKVLSDTGKLQLHLTESEKERMVTIYFDGLNQTKVAGEEVLIIPSPKVATYDKKPEMSVHKIVREFEKQISRNKYHFFVLNFANPDMVAHSGSIKATIKAIEHVDRAIGKLVSSVLTYDGTLVITADHGNAEELLTFPTTSFFFTTSKGDVNTDHSNNPVPAIFISNSLVNNKTKLPRGTLSDVAPTILKLMGLQIPPEMKGNDLFVVKQADSGGVSLSSGLPWVQPDI